MELTEKGRETIRKWLDDVRDLKRNIRCENLYKILTLMIDRRQGQRRDWRGGRRESCGSRRSLRRREMDNLSHSRRLMNRRSMVDRRKTERPSGCSQSEERNTVRFP